MKQFIAFCGSHNSGVQSREGAEKWAAKTLANRPHESSVSLTEVIGTFHRTTPTVEFKAFEPPVEEPSLKVA